jgi:hypothetical protein
MIRENMKYTEFDKAQYRLLALPHPMILHWILNPGVVVSEIILGQRIPRIMVVDKISDKTFLERCFVPCPHCGTLHLGTVWAKGNSFGHWFGYVCPTCEKTIPCLWNIFSFAVLTLLLPIWILPVLLWKQHWLAFELRRTRRRRDLVPFKPMEVAWIRIGIFYWGGAMWFLMSLVPQLWALFNRRRLDLLKMGVQLAIWLAMGLLFGLIVRYFMNRRGRTGRPIY